MTEDLLDTDDDLLDCDEDLLDCGDLLVSRSPFLNNHASMLRMFIFSDESENPNDYKDEVRQLVAQKRNFNVAINYTVAEEFAFFLVKYNKDYKNPFLASVAIQRVQWLRAGCSMLEVLDKNGKRLECEITTATPEGNKVSLSIHPQGERGTRLWFNRDTKRPIMDKKSPYRLA